MRGCVCCRRLGGFPVCACVAFAAVVLAAATGARAQFTCATATPIPVGAATPGSNAASPGDGLAGLCVATSKSAWHSFTAPVSGTYTISLCGSAIDTVATLYSDACAGQVLACDDNTCGNDALLVYPLVGGSAYRLRVASNGNSEGGAYTVLISPPGPPPLNNDSCGQAVALSPNTKLTSTNAGATGTDLSTCGSLDTSDVWFFYSPVSLGMHRVQVCTAAFAPVVSLHNSCIAGISVGCSTNAAVIDCPVPGGTLDFTVASFGTPVLIRVAGVRGSFGPFDIIVYSARPNDLCADAIPLVIGVPYPAQTSPVVGTEGSVACAAASGADVWHRFTPFDSGPYFFSLCGSNFDTVLSVYSGCPGMGGSLLACNDDSCSVQSRVPLALTQNTTYWVRVAGKGSPPAFGNYTITADRQIPPGDDCANAITLTEGVPTPGDTFGATGSDITPCGVTDSIDVWYAFTPAASASYEFNTCGSALNGTISIWSSCAGPMVACAVPSPSYCGPGVSGAVLNAALTGAVKYLVRISGTNGVQDAFTLSVARTPPANDACAAAKALTLGVPVAGTVSGAGASGIPACAFPNPPDAWFTFSPPVSRFYRVSTCGSALDGVLSIHASCPPSAELHCNAGAPGCAAPRGQEIVAILLSGTTYRVRVANKPGSTLGGAFVIVVANAPPPNDLCASAQTLPVNTPVLGTNVNAAATPGVFVSCLLNDALDVWYAFTPAFTGTFQFSTCANPGGTLDTVLSLYTDCAGFPIVCNDNDAAYCAATGPSRIVRGLTAGTPYLVRVAGKGAATGSFWLAAAVAIPPNNTCASATDVGDGTFPFDNLGATTDPVFINDTCGLGLNLISNDVWFRYTASATGSAVASTCGANFDTVIAVSSATGGCPAGIYPPIACSDDAMCVTGSPFVFPQSRVMFSTTLGQKYFVRIGSRFGATGSGMLLVGREFNCPCDWNKDLQLGVQDVLDFLTSFFQDDADFNGDDRTTIQDLFAFLSCFATPTGGCL